MKALKSKLATELLADSVARGQLRDFLVNKRANSLLERQSPSGPTPEPQVANGAFEIRRGSSAGTVFVSVVPKAAKSA
jgi:hypothetical protein